MPRTPKVPLRFPSNLSDLDGLPVLPGGRVTIVGGPFAGEAGEVTGWAGGTRVRVLVESAADPEEFPPLRVVETTQLAVDPTARSVRTSSGIEVHDVRQIPTLLIVPVGGQDIQARSGIDLGPFPSPDEFVTTRTGGQSKPDARRWGQACLDAIRRSGAKRRAALVAAHLDAPMLSRALTDATLPATIRRLAFVVSDQHERPHIDDTAPFGELLGLWLTGSADARARQIEEVAAPVVLTRDPHLTHAVLYTLRSELPRLLGGIEEIVVLQAGGTPAMTMGTLLAAATGLGIPVRLVNPSKDGPVVEVRFPALVPAAS